MVWWVDLFLFFGLVVKLSCVGGLSLLEVHPRFVWLSPCKLPVVLSFMVIISSVLSFELSVMWEFKFRNLPGCLCAPCVGLRIPFYGFLFPFLWDLVSGDIFFLQLM